MPRNLIAVPTDHRSFTHLFRVPICPPLLRTAATAVIAMNVDGAVGFTGRASISGGITKCRMAKCLLPRPSPLHTVEDVAALLSACNEATAALVAGDLKAAARLALPVVGGPFENPATDLPRLLKATHGKLLKLGRQYLNCDIPFPDYLTPTPYLGPHSLLTSMAGGVHRSPQEHALLRRELRPGERGMRPRPTPTAHGPRRTARRPRPTAHGPPPPPTAHRPPCTCTGLQKG